MNEAYERRALLLHMGDVMQTLSRIVEREDEEATLGELMATHQILGDVPPFEQMHGTVSIRELMACSLHAFCLWPRLLLEEKLDYDALSESVRAHLFADNPRGWKDYVTAMRQEVPRFGAGAPVDEGPQRVAERA